MIKEVESNLKFESLASKTRKIPRNTKRGGFENTNPKETLSKWKQQENQTEEKARKLTNFWSFVEEMEILRRKKDLKGKKISVCKRMTREEAEKSSQHLFSHLPKYPRIKTLNRNNY